MKKKIITLVVWLALTVLYVWNLGDSGRYIGSSTTWALEDYSQMMVEYGGTTTDAYHLGAAMGDMANYKMFCDLESKYKKNMIMAGVTTVIYILVTIKCYNVVFKRIEETKNIE